MIEEIRPSALQPTVEKKKSLLDAAKARIFGAAAMEVSDAESCTTSEHPRDAMKRDAGIVASEQLAAVRKKAARSARWWLILYFLAFCTLLVSGGYRLYKTNVENRYYVDSRPCMFKVGDIEFRGTREYRYNADTIFGMRFYDTSSVVEKTSIEIHGDELSIVGHNVKGGEITGWWGTRVDMGEQGKVQLKNSDYYTFVTEDKIEVLPYSQICR